MSEFCSAGVWMPAAVIVWTEKRTQNKLTENKLRIFGYLFKADLHRLVGLEFINKFVVNAK